MAQAQQSTADRSRDGRKSAAAYRTISEVSEELNVPQHVLRFWETKFNQVRPMKRGGGRRYYRPEDVRLLGRIQELLYEEGYTIKGVQRLLKEGQVTAAALVEEQERGPVGVGRASVAPEDGAGRGRAAASLDPELRAALKDLLIELRHLRDSLDV